MFSEDQLHLHLVKGRKKRISWKQGSKLDGDRGRNTEKERAERWVCTRAGPSIRNGPLLGNIFWRGSLSGFPSASQTDGRRLRLSLVSQNTTKQTKGFRRTEPVANNLSLISASVWMSKTSTNILSVGASCPPVRGHNLKPFTLGPGEGLCFGPEVAEPWSCSWREQQQMPSSPPLSTWIFPQIALRALEFLKCGIGLRALSKGQEGCS